MLALTDVQAVQEKEPVCLPVDNMVPRRGFLRFVVILGTGITSVVGGLVGYQPSAMAAPRCDATPPQFTGCGLNYRPCIGPCDASISCCRHADGANGSKCCGCRFVCGNARVVVYASGKSCYYCCQRC